MMNLAPCFDYILFRFLHYVDGRRIVCLKREDIHCVKGKQNQKKHSLKYQRYSSLIIRTFSGLFLLCFVFLYDRIKTPGPNNTRIMVHDVLQS